MVFLLILTGITFHIDLPQNGGGAGVCLKYVGSVGTFTMNDGLISNNKVISGSTRLDNGLYAQGGGVCISDGGKFTLNGGIITGNTASVYGGGVYANNVKKIGGGTIYGNTPRDPYNRNVAGRSYHGNVVYFSSSTVYNYSLRRESTAGPEVDLDSNIAGLAGGWEN